jgi:hypothetical protein
MPLSQVVNLAQEQLGLPAKDRYGRWLRYALYQPHEGRFLNLSLAAHALELATGLRLHLLPRGFGDFFELELLSDPNPGLLFPMPPKELSIGREFGNQIVIRHKAVSRQHGIFEWQDGFHFYMDLGSANGSWLNNQPVTAATPLAPGDILHLGQTVVLLYREQVVPQDGAPDQGHKPIAGSQSETARTGLVQIPKGEIFLSYSPGQAEVMEALAEGLAKTGIQAWHDVDDLGPILQRSALMIAILSREAVASEARQAEWAAFAVYRKPVIVILFEACPFPEVLDDLPHQVVEYRFDDTELGGDVLEALKQLSS